ncbi:hypothetical protein V2J09_022236 [Rumex salicifolius]
MTSTSPLPSGSPPPSLVPPTFTVVFSDFCSLMSSQLYFRSLISRCFPFKLQHHQPLSSTASPNTAISIRHLAPPTFEKFYVFMHKPPSLEMSDLWDDVFPNMVGMGKNVVAPSMNMESVLETQMIVSKAATKVEYEENSADSLERLSNQLSKILSSQLSIQLRS